MTQADFCKYSTFAKEKSNLTNLHETFPQNVNVKIHNMFMWI